LHQKRNSYRVSAGMPKRRRGGTARGFPHPWGRCICNDSLQKPKGDDLVGCCASGACASLDLGDHVARTASCNARTFDRLLCHWGVLPASWLPRRADFEASSRRTLTMEVLRRAPRSDACAPSTSAVISIALSTRTVGLQVCVEDMSSTQASADCRETKVMQRRGNVRGCVGDALEITRPRRRARALSATSMTPQTALEISAVPGRRTGLKNRPLCATEGPSPGGPRWPPAGRFPVAASGQNLVAANKAQAPSM
jgi:hypothetical protein